VQCCYLIDKGIAALIPSKNQSRMVPAPPIKTWRRGNYARPAHDEADASSRTQMRQKLVRYFHAAQDAAKVSCQCNDEDGDK
jgi:hypothetical protein